MQGNDEQSPVAGSKTLPKLIALLIFASGALAVVGVVWRVGHVRLAVFESILPLEITQVSRTYSLLSGVALMYLTRQLWLKKRRAWEIAVALLAIAIVAHLTREFINVFLLLPSVVSLAVLVYYRSIYTVESSRESVGTAVRRTVIILSLLLFYSIAGYFLLQSHFREKVTLDRVFSEYNYQITGEGQVSLTPMTRRAQWFQSSISDIAVVTFLLAIGSLFLPFIDARKPSSKEREVARNLVLSCGSHPTSYFALMPDKQFFFSSGKTGLIAYKVRGGVAAAVGYPAANPGRYKEVTAEFIDAMHQRGLLVAFVNVQLDHPALSEPYKMKALKIGEEALLGTDTFTISGHKMADVRHSVAHAEREGVGYVWHKMSEIPAEVLRQLDQLHGKLAKRRKFSRLSFSLDFYPLPNEPYGYLLTAVSKEERLLGAFSFFPYGKHNYVLDSMLRDEASPNGLTEASLVEAMRFFKDQGVATVSLGGAPLARANQDSDTVLTGAEQMVFNNFSAVYGFASLFNFKKKFQPEWLPMYFVYESNAALPKSLLALLQVHIDEGIARAFIKKSFNRY